jgi:hypothetical protein
VRSLKLPLVAGLVLSLPAWATPTFPSTIRSELSLDQTPACTVCHMDMTGGRGTVTKGFGKALMAEGLTANNDESLKQALAALETKNVDSDSDGTTDIDELRAGTDPEVASAAESDGGTLEETGSGGVQNGPPELTYGCTAASGPFAVALLFAASALLIRLRRGRR